MDQKYKVYYYISTSLDSPIKDFIDSLSEKQQVKILRIFQYIREFGLLAILPHVKKLEGLPLWEIEKYSPDASRVYKKETKDS